MRMTRLLSVRNAHQRGGCSDKDCEFPRATSSGYVFGGGPYKAYARSIPLSRVEIGLISAPVVTTTDLVVVAMALLELRS